MTGIERAPRQSVRWAPEPGGPGEEASTGLPRRRSSPLRRKSRFPVRTVAALGVLSLATAGGAAFLMGGDGQTWDQAKTVATQAKSVAFPTVFPATQPTADPVKPPPAGATKNRAVPAGEALAPASLPSAPVKRGEPRAAAGPPKAAETKAAEPPAPTPELAKTGLSPPRSPSEPIKPAATAATAPPPEPAKLVATESVKTAPTAPMPVPEPAKPEPPAPALSLSPAAPPPALPTGPASPAPEPGTPAQVAGLGPVPAPSSAAAAVLARAPEPLPQPAAPPPRQPTLAAAEADGYLAKAEEALRGGDLSVARLFFGRVAEGGDPRGATGMARSYDQEVLKKLPVFGLKPDRAEAERWYARAREMGSRTARN